MFRDHVTIRVEGGKGGDGASTMRREKFVPRGGPDGGDGGRGGDVIIRANKDLRLLTGFHDRERFEAEDGGNGGKQQSQGKRGKDNVVIVPCGTMIYTIEENKTRTLIADLVEDNQECVIAKGGKGGLGNVHFKTSIHQAPKTADRGLPGEQKTVFLELKFIADIGLVGLPNAGKSTLLAALTNAKPKIAAYPFTTLSPNLGMIDISKWVPLSEKDEHPMIVIADVPGLIEGAHEGKGLGHQFLKHIERTRVLVHVIDASLPDDEFIDAFKTITNELSAFTPRDSFLTKQRKSLTSKPLFVVLNKIDLLTEKDNTHKQKLLKTKKLAPVSFPICAGLSEGLKPFVLELWNELLQHPAFEEGQFIPERIFSAEDLLHPNEYVIEHEDNRWKIRGKEVEKIVMQTFFENEDSLKRMFWRLRKLGVIDDLLNKGINDGDEVEIAGKTFEWE